MMTFNNNEKDFQEKLQKDTEIPVIVHERISQAYRLIENNTAVKGAERSIPLDENWRQDRGWRSSSADHCFCILYDRSSHGKKYPGCGGTF